MEPAFDAESGVDFGMIDPSQPNPQPPTPGSCVLLCERDVAPILYTSGFDYWPHGTGCYSRRNSCLGSDGLFHLVQPSPPGYFAGYLCMWI